MLRTIPVRFCLYLPVSCLVLAELCTDKGVPLQSSLIFMVLMVCLLFVALFRACLSELRFKSRSTPGRPRP